MLFVRLGAVGASIPGRGLRAAVLFVLLPLIAACARAPAPEATAAATPAAVVASADAEAAFRLAAALERRGIAEVPREGKAILVNVPSYELIAFEDGEPVLRSRVVVGRDRHRDRTPVMDATTSVVRFRPSWRPTPLMVERDGYEDEIWPPGPGNPLGLLAIRLGPESLIYLHGTNRPDLFDRETRALSGGCIRVERWAEVAAFVLGIPPEAVREAAEGRATFDMPTSGVPVLVRYETTFPDEDGNLLVHEDVYGRAPVQVAAAE